MQRTPPELYVVQLWLLSAQRERAQISLLPLAHLIREWCPFAQHMVQSVSTASSNIIPLDLMKVREFSGRSRLTEICMAQY